MKYISFIVLLGLLGINQKLDDPTRPNYLKLNKVVNFINDSLLTDTLKVKLIKKEQIQLNYNQSLDTLNFQGAYGPIYSSNPDSIHYESWDYVSDNYTLEFTDSSLSLKTKNVKTITLFKKQLVTRK